MVMDCGHSEDFVDCFRKIMRQEHFGAEQELFHNAIIDRPLDFSNIDAPNISSGTLEMIINHYVKPFETFFDHIRDKLEMEKSVNDIDSVVSLLSSHYLSSNTFDNLSASLYLEITSLLSVSNLNLSQKNIDEFMQDTDQKRIVLLVNDFCESIGFPFFKIYYRSIMERAASIVKKKKSFQVFDGSEFIRLIDLFPISLAEEMLSKAKRFVRDETDLKKLELLQTFSKTFKWAIAGNKRTLPLLHVFEDIDNDRLKFSFLKYLRWTTLFPVGAYNADVSYIFESIDNFVAFDDDYEANEDGCLKDIEIFQLSMVLLELFTDPTGKSLHFLASFAKILLDSNKRFGLSEYLQLIWENYKIDEINRKLLERYQNFADEREKAFWSVLCAKLGNHSANLFNRMQLYSDAQSIAKYIREDGGERDQRTGLVALDGGNLDFLILVPEYPFYDYEMIATLHDYFKSYPTPGYFFMDLANINGTISVDEFLSTFRDGGRSPLWLKISEYLPIHYQNESEREFIRLISTIEIPWVAIFSQTHLDDWVLSTIFHLYNLLQCDQLLSLELTESPFDEKPVNIRELLSAHHEAFLSALNRENIFCTGSIADLGECIEHLISIPTIDYDNSGFVLEQIMGNNYNSATTHERNGNNSHNIVMAPTKKGREH